VAIVLAAVIGAIAWKACHRTNAPGAKHHERCPPVTTRAHRPPAAPAQVRGHVTKKTGGALAGATVALVQTGIGSSSGIGDSAPLFTTTDASGAWTIENVPAGGYVASAAASGFLPANHAKLVIAAGEQHAGIDLSLEAGGAPVRGMVSDFDGKPIGGARIEVIDADTELRAPYLALTGADGKYELSLPDGEHWFTVRRDDFTRTNRSVRVAGKPESVDFKLVRGGTIHGVVIARATGKPVPGAIVEASTEPRRSHWGGEATADDDGKFVLRGAPPGVISLDAYAAGVASAQPIRVGIGIGEQVDSVRLPVDRAVSICGRVVEKGTQNGIAGASIHAASMSASATPRAPEPSGPDGTFQILGVRRGSHFLFARAENKMLAEGKEVEVGDADVTGVVVEMETGATLTGRIDPPRKASIRIVPQGERGTKVRDSLWMVRGDSDASGAWRLDHVPPGNFVLVAATSDGATGTLPIVVGDRDQKDLAVTLEKRASVSGRVIDTKGAPVVGLNVVARPDPRTKARIIATQQLAEGAISDVKGSFKIVGLDAGTYRIVSGDFADMAVATMEKEKPSEPVEVAAGVDLTGIVVTVEPHDGVIRGVVTLDGKPTRDVWVSARLQRPDGSLWPGELGNSEPVLTDATGSFVIDHLLARTYTLVAEGPRGASQGEKAGVKPGDTTTIELQRVGTLTGHVRLRGAPVTSYDLRCRRWPAEPIEVHIDAADGRFTLERLAPGHYQCGVSAKAGNAAGEVDVPAGATRLELTLVPWATITGRAISALNGAPVPHVLAQAYSNSGADYKAAASAMFGGDRKFESDANGRFTIARVANGPGHVSLWDSQIIRPIAHKPYRVTAGERVDIGTMWVVPPRAGDPGTLGLDVKLSGDALEVTTVAPGGPASRADIVPGDKITAIQGHTITELTPKVAQLLLATGSIGAGQTLAVRLARGTTVSVTAAKL
jgi:hypothetical protein